MSDHEMRVRLAEAMGWTEIEENGYGDLVGMPLTTTAANLCPIPWRTTPTPPACGRGVWGGGGSATCSTAAKRVRCGLGPASGTGGTPSIASTCITPRSPTPSAASVWPSAGP